MRARKTLLLTLVLISLAACATGNAPRGPESDPTPPPPELSTIVVPIRASLRPLLPELEARVPKKFADTVRERGIDIRYDVTRDPIVLNMIGNGLHATTTFDYAIEACRGRFPCVSCGFREARRKASVTLQTRLEWDAAWRLRSKTRPLPVHYAKPCAVTWFDIDVTRRAIAPVVNEQLALAAQTIDRNTTALTSLRPHAEEIWSALQTPVLIAPRTWLVFVPRDVALTPISGSGLDITSTLVLGAETQVLIGEKPAIPHHPLPALSVANEPAGGMRVPFDLVLSYEDASQVISGELAGKTWKVSGKPLSIESLKFLPGRRGKLQVEANIDYRGGGARNYKGLIYLEGTPRFDAATSNVVVPDLDYALDPKGRSVIQRIAEAAAHDSIRARLRDSVRFPLAARLAAIRSEINSALTRQLAPGVQLRGRTNAIQPVSVTPLARSIVVRAVATGEARVDVQF